MKGYLSIGLAAASCLSMLAALFMVFVYVPTEVEQGIVQRIFYFPSALRVGGVSGLRDGSYRRCPLPMARSQDLGRSRVCVCGTGNAVLHAGADHRFNLGQADLGGLVDLGFASDHHVHLWLLYGGYLLLRAFADDSDEIARFAAVLGIVGVVDVPVIIISVRLWRTIHPAVLLTRQGEHGLEDPRMIATLLVSLGAFTIMFIWLLWLRLSTLRLSTRVATLRKDLALLEAGAHR